MTRGCAGWRRRDRQSAGTRPRGPGAGWSTGRCWGGDESRQLTWLHRAHRRRWNHQPPAASHSTHPVPLRGTSASIAAAVIGADAEEAPADAACPCCSSPPGVRPAIRWAATGTVESVFDVDWMGLLTREVLRERAAELIAEACAWSVGMSDEPHHLRSGGRIVTTGSTVGERAARGLPLSGDEDGRLDLGDARPGSFQDALNSVDARGAMAADRFDVDVLHPFVHSTCLAAAERARRSRPADWAELADDVGEDPADLDDVVRAGGWEAPLRIDAEHLVLAALGDVTLIEVEAEGLPLSLVRAAEAVARASAGPPDPGPAQDDLAGSLFLAQAAVRATGAPLPLRPEHAERLVEELLAHGLDPDDVIGVLPHLPVRPDTADEVVAIVRAAGIG